MKRKMAALAGIVGVAVVAFLFLAPVVPFSKTFYTGLPGNVPPSSPQCPYLSVSSVNPTLDYKGYESVSYYFGGAGVMFYTECTLK